MKTTTMITQGALNDIALIANGATSDDFLIQKFKELICKIFGVFPHYYWYDGLNDNELIFEINDLSEFYSRVYVLPKFGKTPQRLKELKNPEKVIFLSWKELYELMHTT